MVCAGRCGRQKIEEREAPGCHPPAEVGGPPGQAQLEGPLHPLDPGRKLTGTWAPGPLALDVGLKVQGAYAPDTCLVVPVLGHLTAEGDDGNPGDDHVPAGAGCHPGGDVHRLLACDHADQEVRLLCVVSEHQKHRCKMKDR